MGKPAFKITELLENYSNGNSQKVEELFAEVFGELRNLAHRYMSKERKDHTLQPTALVNEVFVRMSEGAEINFKNRVHFFAIAAQMMRRILVDYARAKRSQKRGAGQAKLEFDEKFHWTPKDDNEILALDSALVKLSKLDQRQAQIVELRYFAGLTIEETAEVMKTSPATIKRDWALAKMWLYREIQETK